MDRLTKTSDNSDMVWFVDHDTGINLEPCEMNPRHSKLSIQKLARYEDLDEQGRLLVLPCNVGDTIYQIYHRCVCTIGHTNLHSTCNSPIECRVCRSVEIKKCIRETTFTLSLLDRIGEDFFVSREDAEAALENM